MKLGHFDAVSLWYSQAWHSTVSWSPVINVSFFSSKYTKITRQSKAFPVSCPTSPFLYHTLQFSYCVQCSMKNVPSTRLELSTAQVSTMSTFHSKKTVAWISIHWCLMKINVKLVSGFKEFRISSTVLVQCQEPQRTDCQLRPVNVVPINSKNNGETKTQNNRQKMRDSGNIEK